MRKLAFILLILFNSSANAVEFLNYMADGTRYVLLSSKCKASPSFNKYLRMNTSQEIIETGCYGIKNGWYVLLADNSKKFVYYPMEKR